MRCLQCGGNYVGMKQANKFNCPHCGELKKDETN
jgi:predicted RNA-binding Zn-ribbon protein involved in translation (DUF1610 family)